MGIVNTLLIVDFLICIAFTPTHTPKGGWGFITLPPNPLSSRRGGINITGGHPQSPARGRTLWTPPSITIRFVRLADSDTLFGELGP